MANSKTDFSTPHSPMRFAYLYILMSPLPFTSNLLYSGLDDSFGRQEETTQSSFRKRSYTYHGLTPGGGGMHVGSYQYGKYGNTGYGVFKKGVQN